MNLQEFRKNRLFKIGCLNYDRDTDTVFSHSLASFDTTIVDDELLLKIRERDYQNVAMPVGPALSRALDSTVGDENRKALIDQWREVEAIVSALPVRPYVANLIVQPPAGADRLHTHAKVCKQTMTFCFTYTEESIESSSESHLFISDTIVPYTNEHKIMFSFRDNPKHRSVSNEWRFFWVYDFDKYVEVPSNTDFKRIM
jgi:hypothetical protein